MVRALVRADKLPVDLETSVLLAYEISCLSNLGRTTQSDRARYRMTTRMVLPAQIELPSMNGARAGKSSGMQNYGLYLAAPQLWLGHLHLPLAETTACR
ncbi:MAG: hypothetical protein C0465_26990 [Ralstonia sp.]|nr:hypothetical protein [Ralstonia sp.]